MPRWQYTTTRRILMQVVLCIVLGGSVCLAQWVIHDRQTHSDITLGSVRQMGAIGVRLPVGWKLLSQTPAQLDAEESTPDDSPGRNLVIAQERKIFIIPPESKYRFMNIPTQPIQIGPYQGVLVGLKQRGDALLPDEVEPFHYLLLAECVSPKGLAITVQLDCPAPTTEDDQQLIREIAKAIVVPARH